MSAPTETSSGVWATLKRMSDTLLATVQNRLELFAVELEAEKCRLIESLLWAVAVGVCGLMTLTLITLAIVVLFWENGRLVALLSLAGVYLVGMAVAWRSLRARLRSGTAFSGTLGEIRKDRSCLETDR